MILPPTLISKVLYYLALYFKYHVVWDYGSIHNNPVIFGHQQHMSENLFLWKPKGHYLIDRWTQQCYRVLVWKRLNLLLLILKAFPRSQSMDVKCVGRTTLFKNESAGSRLSDVSGYQAAVIHQACSLGSLLWARCLTWGSVSLEAELIKPRLCGHGWGWIKVPGVWPGLCVCVFYCVRLAAHTCSLLPV